MLCLPHLDDPIDPALLHYLLQENSIDIFLVHLLALLHAQQTHLQLQLQLHQSHHHNTNSGHQTKATDAHYHDHRSSWPRSTVQLHPSDLLHHQSRDKNEERTRNAVEISSSKGSKRQKSNDSTVVQRNHQNIRLEGLLPFALPTASHTPFSTISSRLRERLQRLVAFLHSRIAVENVSDQQGDNQDDSGSRFSADSGDKRSATSGADHLNAHKTTAITYADIAALFVPLSLLQRISRTRLQLEQQQQERWRSTAADDVVVRGEDNTMKGLVNYAELYYNVRDQLLQEDLMNKVKMKKTTKSSTLESSSPLSDRELVGTKRRARRSSSVLAHQQEEQRKEKEAMSPSSASPSLQHASESGSDAVTGTRDPRVTLSLDQAVAEATGPESVHAPHTPLKDEVEGKEVQKVAGSGLLGGVLRRQSFFQRHFSWQQSTSISYKHNESRDEDDDEKVDEDVDEDADGDTDNGKEEKEDCENEGDRDDASIADEEEEENTGNEEDEKNITVDEDHETAEAEEEFFEELYEGVNDMVVLGDNPLRAEQKRLVTPDAGHHKAIAWLSAKRRRSQPLKVQLHLDSTAGEDKNSRRDNIQARNEDDVDLYAVFDIEDTNILSHFDMTNHDEDVEEGVEVGARQRAQLSFLQSLSHTQYEAWALALTRRLYPLPLPPSHPTHQWYLPPMVTVEEEAALSLQCFDFHSSHVSLQACQELGELLASYLPTLWLRNISEAQLQALFAHWLDPLYTHSDDGHHNSGESGKTLVCVEVILQTSQRGQLRQMRDWRILRHLYHRLQIDIKLSLLTSASSPASTPFYTSPFSSASPSASQSLKSSRSPSAGHVAMLYAYMPVALDSIEDEDEEDLALSCDREEVKDAQHDPVVTKPSSLFQERYRQREEELLRVIATCANLFQQEDLERLREDVRVLRDIVSCICDLETSELRTSSGSAHDTSSAAISATTLRHFHVLLLEYPGLAPLALALVTPPRHLLDSTRRPILNGQDSKYGSSTVLLQHNKQLFHLLLQHKHLDRYESLLCAVVRAHPECLMLPDTARDLLPCDLLKRRDDPPLMSNLHHGLPNLHNMSVNSPKISNGNLSKHSTSLSTVGSSGGGAYGANFRLLATFVNFAGEPAQRHFLPPLSLTSPASSLSASKSFSLAPFASLQRNTSTSSSKSTAFKGFKASTKFITNLRIITSKKATADSLQSNSTDNSVTNEIETQQNTRSNSHPHSPLDTPNAMTPSHAHFIASSNTPLTLQRGIFSVYRGEEDLIVLAAHFDLQALPVELQTRRFEVSKVDVSCGVHIVLRLLCEEVAYLLRLESVAESEVLKEAASQDKGIQRGDSRGVSFDLSSTAVISSGGHNESSYDSGIFKSIDDVGITSASHHEVHPAINPSFTRAQEAVRCYLLFARHMHSRLTSARMSLEEMRDLQEVLYFEVVAACEVQETEQKQLVHVVANVEVAEETHFVNREMKSGEETTETNQHNNYNEVSKGRFRLFPDDLNSEPSPQQTKIKKQRQQRILQRSAIFRHLQEQWGLEHYIHLNSADMSANSKTDTNGSGDTNSSNLSPFPSSSFSIAAVNAVSPNASTSFALFTKHMHQLQQAASSVSSLTEGSRKVKSNALAASASSRMATPSDPKETPKAEDNLQRVKKVQIKQPATGNMSTKITDDHPDNAVDDKRMETADDEADDKEESADARNRRVVRILETESSFSVSSVVPRPSSSTLTERSAASSAAGAHASASSSSPVATSSSSSVRRYVRAPLRRVSSAVSTFSSLA